MTYVIKRTWTSGKVVYLQLRDDDVVEVEDAKNASQFSLMGAELAMSRNWANPYWVEEAVKYG